MKWVSGYSGATRAMISCICQVPVIMISYPSSQASSTAGSHLVSSKVISTTLVSTLDSSWAIISMPSAALSLKDLSPRVPLSSSATRRGSSVVPASPVSAVSSVVSSEVPPQAARVSSRATAHNSESSLRNFMMLLLIGQAPAKHAGAVSGKKFYQIFEQEARSHACHNS